SRNESQGLRGLQIDCLYCSFWTCCLFYSRRSSCREAFSVKSLCMIFLLSFLGITIFLNLQFEGIHLASSSIASAMSNLIPAVTFIITASIGWEKIEIRSKKSMAKVLGTICCVTGAIIISFLRGSKISNLKFHTQNSMFLLGCVLLASQCRQSLWMILQVPVSKFCPDNLSFSAWTCFMATSQSAVLTLFLESDPTSWNIKSSFELLCILYGGIVGSGLSFFLLPWCISKRGPLFAAMFSPLSTVITTILASLILHEDLFIGSLSGAILVIGGLYAVLWGKTRDLTDIKTDERPRNESTMSCKINLEEPLLAHDKSLGVGEG
ncbi:PREDICTED: WAT1-related protein At4g30420-like, partial [Nelumbo nucifera]|uniref:WAT1-related protein n=1 Tax=Nelumbo nucifera TaxID=4432 RepID=A0A1U8Q774_NELNU